MTRQYYDFVQDILDAAVNIQIFINGMTKNEFVADLKTVLAVVKSVEIMGEASKRVPNKIKDAYPEIPWRQMAGIRDKLTHEYFGIDLQILWFTVTEKIPEIEPMVRKVLQDLEQER